MNENTDGKTPKPMIDPETMVLTIPFESFSTIYDVYVSEVGGHEDNLTSIKGVHADGKGELIVDYLLNQPHRKYYGAMEYYFIVEAKQPNGGTFRGWFTLNNIQALAHNQRVMFNEIMRLSRTANELSKWTQSSDKSAEMLHQSTATMVATLHELEKQAQSLVTALEDIGKSSAAHLSGVTDASERQQSDLAEQIATLNDNNGKYDGILWSARRNLGRILSEMVLEFEGSKKLNDGQWDNFLIEKQQQFEALRISLAEKPPVVPRQFTEAMERVEKLYAEFREYMGNVERKLGTKAESGVVEGLSHGLRELRDEVAKLAKCLDTKADASELKLLVQQLSEFGKRLDSFETKLKTATAAPAPVPVTPQAAPAPAPAPTPIPTPAQMGVPPLPSRLEVVGTKVRGLWTHADRRQIGIVVMIVVIMATIVGTRFVVKHRASTISKLPTVDNATTGLPPEVAALRAPNYGVVYRYVGTQ